jgi:hypothetical protein
LLTYLVKEKELINVQQEHPLSIPKHSLKTLEIMGHFIVFISLWYYKPGHNILQLREISRVPKKQKAFFVQTTKSCYWHKDC